MWAAAGRATMDDGNWATRLVELVLLAENNCVSISRGVNVHKACILNGRIYRRVQMMQFLANDLPTLVVGKRSKPPVL